MNIQPKPKLLDQVREALLARHFLYRHIIGREVGDLGEVIRARKPARLPVVMTREEVKAVLGGLKDEKWLMASLMYGAGLRINECLCLRVQDVDFARNEITIHNGKGEKDRVTMLPESPKKMLQEHLKKVRVLHEKDLRDGWGRVQMPEALDRKYSNATRDWRWQCFFLRRTGGRVPRQVKRGVIIWMNQLYKRHLKRLLIRLG
jgi:integrase